MRHTRSRAWFQHQVAAIGALARTFPRRRQLALFDHLTTDAPDPTPPADRPPQPVPSPDAHDWPRRSRR